MIDVMVWLVGDGFNIHCVTARWSHRGLTRSSSSSTRAIWKLLRHSSHVWNPSNTSAYVHRPSYVRSVSS